jgi:hypothetical protein
MVTAPAGLHTPRLPSEEIRLQNLGWHFNLPAVELIPRNFITPVIDRQ